MRLDETFNLQAPLTCDVPSLLRFAGSWNPQNAFNVGIARNIAVAYRQFFVPLEV